VSSLPNSALPDVGLEEWSEMMKQWVRDDGEIETEIEPVTGFFGLDGLWYGVY